MAKFYSNENIKKIQSLELQALKDFIDLCERHHLRYFAIAGTCLGAIRHRGFIPWDDDIDVALPREDFNLFIKYADKELTEKYYLLDMEHNENYPLFSTRLCVKGTHFVEEYFKSINCPFGIFLDIYAYDNLADEKKDLKKQVRQSWLYSKLIILWHIRKPFLFQKGFKAKMIWAACGLIHGCLHFFHVPLKWLQRKGEGAVRRYEHVKTRRMGLLTDTDPAWGTLATEDIFPVVKVPFEDIEINLPQNYKKLMTQCYGADYMTPPAPENRKTHYPAILDFGDGINVADDGVIKL